LSYFTKSCSLKFNIHISMTNGALVFGYTKLSICVP